MSQAQNPSLPVSPQHDPWDPIHLLRTFGRHVLTSVELTVTNQCNMRCEHCAVGDSLNISDPSKIDVNKILCKLDEVEHLQTISITGGEPSYNQETLIHYIMPILRYAKQRGVRTQLNSNLTLNLSRYEMMIPFLDVMHISFNYLNSDDFHEVGFVNHSGSVSKLVAAKLYEQMISNAVQLSSSGMKISAESMINYRTHRKLAEIHQIIVQMGCFRHEVHPMYPSSFAQNLPELTLDDFMQAIHRLLDTRHPDIWLLFGTLPVFWCSSSESELMLLKRLRETPNVTVRNDPDGRSRLNVDIFTGDIRVTDFAKVPPLGNIMKDGLDDVFARWMDHPLKQTVSCYCPEAGCCGPNFLVKDMYYQEIDFQSRKASVLK
ncbi:MAG: radical SAM/CxCxxxxC motif protein YfkAB [Paenibacillus sp. RIFOXYA1_FULL_44_5]|nr:MAG: radical SAM/CxCxxxxC motif protein YfkAB [Paenibacillus sp. RIFOXYA1_FULL_44_5]